MIGLTRITMSMSESTTARIPADTGMGKVVLDQHCALCEGPRRSTSSRTIGRDAGCGVESRRRAVGRGRGGCRHVRKRDRRKAHVG